MKPGNTIDQLSKHLRTISADLKLYVEKKTELIILTAGEYFSTWIAMSIQKAAGAVLILGGICFLLVALAIYLGELLDNRSLGYVLVSLPLLIIGGLFVYLKPKSLFDQLQQRLEAELIEAISENGEADGKTFPMPESLDQSESDK